jgi:hypothetical protein
MPESLIEKLPDRIETALAELLTSGEIVQVKLKGAFKEGLVCTESRVIILKGGFMAGQMLGTTCFQQSYSNISGVQVKFHFGTGYLELNSGGMQNTPKSYWSTDKSGDPAKAPNCISLNNKNQKEKFQRACTFILQKIYGAHGSDATRTPAQTATTMSQDEIFAAIEKLGKLKDAGVLSEAEFLTKKTDLLQRL